MNPRFLCAGIVSFAVATAFSADILDDTLRFRYNFDAAPAGDVIVDSSSNGSHPGTNRNAVWIASDLGRNGAMDFSALIPDRITVPAIPAYNSPQGTISFWIKTPGASGPGDYAAMLIDRRESSGDVITLTDNGTLFVQAREGFQNKNAFSGVTLVNDNQWHHVAYVYDQTAEGAVSLYVDGVLDATNPNSAAWTWEPTRAFEFGSSHDAFWRVFNGLMDDVNVYNRKLTDTEIANTAGGTSVTDSSLVLRLNFAAAPVNNVVADSSPSNNPGTNAGAIFVASDGTHNGVMKFEIPVMTQITTAAAEDINSTVGTIAFWMKSTGNAGLGDYASILFDRRLSNVGDQLTMVDDGTLFVQARAGAGNVNSFATQGKVNDGLWHHVAYVYDQSDTGYIQIYIDGASSASNSNAAAWSWPAEQSFEFGLSHDTYWHAFDGQLDEIRFYNQALTAAQIADIGVPPTLKFDLQPQGSMVFVGDDVTLRGLANVEATYQWKLNGQDVPGATSNVLHIASATAGNSGTYTLTANSVIGPGTSDPAVLTVSPRPSVDASLVARYPFDAAPVNNVIIDAAPGNEHPGTNNLATWTDAVDGHNGVMFFESAQSSQIVIAPHAEFDTSRGTIALWMKSPGAFAPGDYGSIIFDRRSNRGDVIVMQDNGAIFTQTHSTSARVSSFSTPDVVNDDQWHHIAYVYDQVAGGSIAVYIDGELSISNEISGPWSWDPARPLEIGKSGDSYWKRFDGYMDDIRFYNRRMNAAEIAQISGIVGLSLSISKTGNQITLTWSDAAAALQESSDLGNPNGWANVAGNPPSPATITIPATGMKFYRLQK